MVLHVATALLSRHLGNVEQQFSDGRPFLLGSDATIADFSFFHPLWFIQRASAVAGFLTTYPRTTQWMQRIAAIGHGTATPLSSGEAIEIARAGVTVPLRTEAVQTPGPCPLGARVTVAPTDYGIDPVPGELIAEYTNEWIVKRTDPRAGAVRADTGCGGRRRTMPMPSRWSMSRRGARRMSGWCRTTCWPSSIRPGGRQCGAREWRGPPCCSLPNRMTPSSASAPAGARPIRHRRTPVKSARSTCCGMLSVRALAAG